MDFGKLQAAKDKVSAAIAAAIVLLDKLAAAPDQATVDQFAADIDAVAQQLSDAVTKDTPPV